MFGKGRYGHKNLYLNSIRYANPTNAVRDLIREKHRPKLGEIIDPSHLDKYQKVILYLALTGLKLVIQQSTKPEALTLAGKLNFTIDTRYTRKE